MTLSLEQELEAIAAGSDYRLGVHTYGNSIIIDVIYVPAFQAVDMGGRLPLVTNSGVIGHRWFGRWRQWPRAHKWVRRTIDGHRELLMASGVKQVR